MAEAGSLCTFKLQMAPLVHTLKIRWISNKSLITLDVKQTQIKLFFSEKMVIWCLIHELIILFSCISLVNWLIWFKELVWMIHLWFRHCNMRWVFCSELFDYILASVNHFKDVSMRFLRVVFCMLKKNDSLAVWLVMWLYSATGVRLEKWNYLHRSVWENILHPFSLALPKKKKTSHTCFKTTTHCTICLCGPCLIAIHRWP